MKLHTLRNAGYILVEATVGVALFFILLIALLRGVAIMISQATLLQQRHTALCAAQYVAHAVQGDVTEAYVHVTTDMQMSSYAPAYAHSSVTWQQITAQVGNERVILYAARCDL